MSNAKRLVYQGNDLRGEAVRQLVRRLEDLESGQTLDLTIDAAGAVEQLRRRGCALTVGDDVLYAPSWEVRQEVFEAPMTAAWGEKVVKKQKAAFRSAPGAIVRLPVEGGAEAVAAFITDWSPFPAAAAVAVHPLHPLAHGSTGEGDHFARKFVRHPLTGDLLPVWVAAWVRPDFGTGAVVVNPAHSAVDLDFARQMGLPIRFALAESAVTCDPATWPEPPVVKKGTTNRAALYSILASAVSALSARRLPS